MEPDIIETHAVAHHKHQDTIKRLRMRPDDLMSLGVNTQGWVIARFREGGVMIAGMLPASLSWLAGIRTELVEFSTMPVDNTTSEQGEIPLQYQLHLRLRPIPGDPHAIGHAHHENEALLQKPPGGERGGRPGRALARAGDRGQGDGRHRAALDQWRNPQGGARILRGTDG